MIFLVTMALKLFMQYDKLPFLLCKNAKTFADVRSSHPLLAKKITKRGVHGLSVHVVTFH